MNTEILKPGAKLKTEYSNLACEVICLVKEGGQGFVYKASLNGTVVALKWYKDVWVKHDPGMRDRLRKIIAKGPPDDKFLWPFELVTCPTCDKFGYLMPYAPQGYFPLLELLKEESAIDPSMETLTTTGLSMASSFSKLHSDGWCYRDISAGNIFFHPTTGDTRIADNDNVEVDGEAVPMGGTPYFAAPEMVRRESGARSNTDLHSLAVLLFWMLMGGHPLEGRKADEDYYGPAVIQRMFGTECVFIFDPADDSNRPRPDSRVVNSWPIYPEFLRRAFTRVFTTGLREPDLRVPLTEWRKIMSRLRDAIHRCPACKAENFYCGEYVQSTGGKPAPCWSCQSTLTLPPRMRIDNEVFVLRSGAQLYPHHVDRIEVDFSRPVGQVVGNPLSLRNLTNNKWVVKNTEGSWLDIPPGTQVELESVSRINFGKREGNVKMA